MKKNRNIHREVIFEFFTSEGIEKRRKCGTSIGKRFLVNLFRLAMQHVK